MDITYMLFRPGMYNWDCYKKTKEGLHYCDAGWWLSSRYGDLVDLVDVHPKFSIVDISWV